MKTMRREAAEGARSGSVGAAVRGLWAICLGSILLGGCAGAARQFESPEAASAALVSALRDGDSDKLVAIFGSEGEEIVRSGDEVADRQRYGRFLALYDKSHALQTDGKDRRVMTIGESAWPFPVPIVRRGEKWAYDATEGKEEILNRRIGENELSAIEVCKAIGDAQREYAHRDPDKNGMHDFAQQFPSRPGKRDGLYYPVDKGQPPSPLGALAASAAAEGYARRKKGTTPYHGYYYRILTSQGTSAPNGKMNYLVKDKMILGFAVVAFPAEYGNSGIMTFTMGPDGVVHQKDLGERTDELGLQITTFDPDDSWARCE
jgi:hypothetical protein